MQLGRTVEELDASLSLDELYMWVAYSASTPWGDDREDWRNAQTNWLMASLWGDGKKKYKINDFLLQFDKKKDRIKPSEGVDVNKWNYLVLQAMFGGR